ncbi:probable RNA-binding protein EIF1AD [Chenopodium quinoa]|uniref:S1-like domain-containing protein n=1 Tax=Chenopodium quinoa TaxID=63459 RepID=A0A803L8G1_CHEQI|nr:probable RNA-binding protein EIF1AD [Chenopodium quinoa]
MGRGRKNLKREVEEDDFTLQQGQSIMQVVSLRGSNLIEVTDGKGEKSLALFPAKFQKSMWIKNGSFVVVDDSGKEEALESGSKVGCIVSQVLFHDKVRRLQKSSDWPEAFKSQAIDSSTRNSPRPVSEQEAEDSGSSDDDGLPPLETNMNRRRPYDLHSGSASNSDADSDTNEES